MAFGSLLLRYLQLELSLRTLKRVYRLRSVTMRRSSDTVRRKEAALRKQTH